MPFQICYFDRKDDKKWGEGQGKTENRVRVLPVMKEKEGFLACGG